MTPEHIDTSIARALKGESGLDPEVLKIHGFSTPTMRRAFNNICNVEGLTYCECGVFCGGTLISAFNNNPITAIGIEDFSQDFSRQGVRAEFYANLDRWYKPDSKGSIVTYERDCFTVAKDLRAKDALGFIDVLFYDAHHDRVPTGKALPAFFDMLNDHFLLIFDDASWRTVRDGIQDGFDALSGRLKIEKEWHLSDHRPDGPRWHNDVKLYLISKIK